MDAWTEWANAQHVYWREVAAGVRRKRAVDEAKRDKPNGTEYSSCGCFYPHLGDCAPKS